MPPCLQVLVRSQYPNHFPSTCAHRPCFQFPASALGHATTAGLSALHPTTMLPLPLEHLQVQRPPVPHPDTNTATSCKTRHSDQWTCPAPCAVTAASMNVHTFGTSPTATSTLPLCQHCQWCETMHGDQRPALIPWVATATHRGHTQSSSGHSTPPPCQHHSHCKSLHKNSTLATASTPLKLVSVHRTSLLLLARAYKDRFHCHCHTKHFGWDHSLKCSDQWSRNILAPLAEQVPNLQWPENKAGDLISAPCRITAHSLGVLSWALAPENLLEMKSVG